MEIQAITNRCFGLFMRRNVSISRNRNKIERLLDWKEFPSKSVGRFSFHCLTFNRYLQSVCISAILNECVYAIQFILIPETVTYMSNIS